jgi:DNA-binding XRE family transcriptional regulator
MSKHAVKSSSAPTAEADPRNVHVGLNARVRARRSQLGLSGVELAERAGISPSYVSLIEKGAKVPDEDVAVALARVLEDDADLYRAWARAARLGLHDLALLQRLELIARTPAYVSLVESGRELPRLASPDAPSDETTELAARLREVAGRLSVPADAPRPRPASPEGPAAPPTLRVPVLVDGAEPGPAGSPPPPSAVRDHFSLDPRLLARGPSGPLFACRVSPESLKHLRGLAEPGDVVVFERNGRPAARRICAVRTSHGLVLARVLYQGPSLLLLPGEGEHQFESLHVGDEQGLADVVLGAQVLLIRR